MKSLPRIGCQFVWSSLLVATLGAGAGLAQTPDDLPVPKGPAAILRSVKMISDAEGPALEIISSQTPQPAIEFLDSPPRLVIDLPHTMDRVPNKRIAGGQRAGERGAHKPVSADAAGGPRGRGPGPSRGLQQRHPGSTAADSHAPHGRGPAEHRDSLRPCFHQGSAAGFRAGRPRSYRSGGRSGQPAFRRFRGDGGPGDYDFASGPGRRSAGVSQNNSLRDALAEWPGPDAGYQHWGARSPLHPERLRRFNRDAGFPHAAGGPGRIPLRDQRRCSRGYMRARLAAETRLR